MGRADEIDDDAVTGQPGMIDLSRNLPPLSDRHDACFGAALAAWRARDGVAAARALPPGGTPSDREAAAAWLAPRFGAAMDPDRIIVTSGIHAGLLMIFAALLRPGAALMVESLMATGVRALTELMGLRLEPVAIDDQGVRPDAFDEACRRSDATALFCVPTLHNPTTAVMPRPRRVALAAIARTHGRVIVEDDVCGMLPLNAVEPIAALAPDASWHVAGLGKCVALGLRIGYIVAPSAPHAAKLVAASSRRASTWMAAPLIAALARDWLADGTAYALCSMVRAEAEARQHIAAAELAGLEVVSHRQSLHLSLRLPSDMPVGKFVEHVRRRGVRLRTSDTAAVGCAAPTAARICLGAAPGRSDLASALATIRACVENAGATPARGPARMP